MASLSFQSIVKHYSGNPEPTLRGIDLEVTDGEFLVLVGPSGCGKSTLLRAIAGLESITGGELLIGDRVVNKLAPKDRDIAMVFQSYALYPHMTVRRNIAFGLEVRKTPRAKIDALVNEAAKMLDLEPYLHKLPKHLSGGQRQRVAMGRAIVRRPKVFLFDEPLSNLDAALRNQMRVEIRRLHKQLETTMVYVTHDQVEAMTLADRIAVLDKGVLQQVGSPLELFYSPHNRFVAGFIGSPSMNFFNAVLRQDNDGWSLLLAGDIVLRLDPPSDAELVPGRRVVMGVRPQSLELAHGRGSTNIVSLPIKITETLGWEAHVHLEFAGLPLLAVLEAPAVSHLKTGDALELQIPSDEILLFDPDDGHALFLRSPKRDARTSSPTPATAG